MNAYKELRKEKVLSCDEDEFIKMLEDQLVDENNTKKDAEKNVTELKNNISAAQSKVVELEAEISSMKAKCDVVTVDDDDDESVEVIGPRVAVQSKKQKSTDEIEREIEDVFIDNDTTLEASQDDVDAVMLEQDDLVSDN